MAVADSDRHRHGGRRGDDRGDRRRRPSRDAAGRARPDAAARGTRAIAWFDSPAPLRSGWAWGQHYLEHGAVGIESRVGRGRVVLFGAEILQRAQPHATFRFLFNSIFSK